MHLLKSRLSPVWVFLLDAVTTNNPAEHRDGLPSAQSRYCLLLTLMMLFPIFAFFSIQSYSLQIPQILTFFNSNPLYRN